LLREIDKWCEHTKKQTSYIKQITDLIISNLQDD